jgi:FMN phosphatase YigB (HAD superfamily)
LKLEAILFDLDNTLILFNENEFFKIYSYKLSQYFNDLMSFEEFTNRLVSATQAMVENDGKQYNLDLFMDAFSNGTASEKDEQLQRFQRFYNTQFDQFRSLTTPVDGVRDTVMSLHRNDLKIVIASNPMFPLNVQQMRIEWANIGDIPFSLITGVDNSKYCKPKLEYYLEICEKIDTRPDRCLMVGNDALNDMIASKVGMRTYLTTDCAYDSYEMSKEFAKNFKMELPKPDHQAPLSHLLDIIFP